MCTYAGSSCSGPIYSRTLTFGQAPRFHADTLPHSLRKRVTVRARPCPRVLLASNGLVLALAEQDYCYGSHLVVLSQCHL